MPSLLSDSPENPLPIGKEFLDVVSGVETTCAAATLREMSSLGLNRLETFYPCSTRKRRVPTDAPAEITSGKN